MKTKRLAPKQLDMSEDMTIYPVTEQKALLLDARAETQCLALDINPVTRIDSTGLQLLLLVKLESAQQGKGLSILGSSHRVKEVIEFCNLTGTFGEPIALSARSSLSSQQF